MTKRKLVTFLAGLFLWGHGFCATQEISQITLDSSDKISAINDNFNYLYTGKLDARPGNVIPRLGSRYTLGSSAYPWAAMYASSATFSYLGVNGDISFMIPTNNIDKGIYWGTPGSVGFGRIYRNSASGALTIDAQTELLLNTGSTGNVGIGNGNTSPTTTLQVNGTFSLNGRWDGWIGSTATWTYISSTQFSVPNDVTGVYQKGDKVKLTQTTAKYFYVTAVTAGVSVTTITVNGGSDYTLANAAITSPFYSKEATPQSFPQWFNFSTSWTGSGSNPAINNGTIVSRFSVSANKCSVMINVSMGAGTTYGTGSYGFSIPITAASSGEWDSLVNAEDSGLAQYGSFVRITASATATAQIITIATGVPWQTTTPFTWGTSDSMHMYFSYEI